MSQKRFEIIGRDLSNEEKERAFEVINQRRVKLGEKLQGEYEKTDLEKKIISLVSKYLAEELRSLDLEPQELQSSQVHILSPELFEELFPNVRSSAFYHSLNNQIYVRRGTQANFLEYFKQLLHETIHLASFSKFLIDKESGKAGTYRTGYTNADPRRQYDTFRGLNEAVVDRMAMDITFKNSKEIISGLGADGDKQTVTTWYAKPLEVLDILIKRISITSGEDPAMVWKKFKSGEFSGSMMYLRSIEKTFGKGALKIIAKLPAARLPERPRLIDDILSYLNTDDLNTRESMARQILEEKQQDSKLE